jgi:acyl carrier protein
MRTTENMQATKAKQQLSSWLVKKLSTLKALNESDIKTDKPIASYGLDSLHAMAIAGELEDMLDVELPSTMLWEYPTIDKITLFLYEQLFTKKHQN